MNAPDKIYMPNELLSEEWQRHIEGEDTAYIRKETLLKWAKAKHIELDPPQNERDFGRIEAVEELIDKINSLRTSSNKSKTEVERLIEECDVSRSQHRFGKMVACNRILNFLDTIQEQPGEWSEKHVADVFEKVGLSKIVREQGNDELTNAVQSAMIELSKGNSKEQMIKEDLEKEIESFWGSFYRKETRKHSQINNDFRIVARHFAQWQKEQMMRSAVKGEVCIPNCWVEDKEGKELVVRAEISKELGFKFGQKVKLIIIKED